MYISGAGPDLRAGFFLFLLAGSLKIGYFVTIIFFSAKTTLFMNLRNFLLALLMLLGFSCSTTQSVSPGSTDDHPALVVFISVDQMRADYFDRFGDQFQYGLKRLQDKGLFYKNAHHLQVPTNTAPGHATLSTGAFPARHGILSNNVYNPEEGRMQYCVEDSKATILGVEGAENLAGRSPRVLLTNTVGDWLKAASPRSKVYSVAIKDRAAVLLGGKMADRAFWFDNLSTQYVSSDYYGKSFPDWAGQISGKATLGKEMAEGWHKKFPEATYERSREDRNQFEMGSFLPDFPHTLERMRPGLPEGSKPGIFFTTSPYGDLLTLTMARRILEVGRLGQDDHTDILFVGCSVADYIGHHFGPYSQEVQDYYLRLDEYLGDFFSYLDEKVGKDNYWVVLSADHGVIPFPEEMVKRGVPDARRIPAQIFGEALQRFNNELMEEMGLSASLIAGMGQGLHLNLTETTAKGISPETVRSRMAAKIRSLDYIADVYTREDLAGTVDKPYIQMYRNSFDPVNGPDLMIHQEKNVLILGGTGTTHGSPYDYDSNVPVILLGKRFAPQTVATKMIATADVAPTLAALLGIAPTNAVDGKVLSEATAEK